MLVSCKKKELDVAKRSHVYVETVDFKKGRSPIGPTYMFPMKLTSDQFEFRKITSPGTSENLSFNAVPEFSQDSGTVSRCSCGSSH